MRRSRISGATLRAAPHPGSGCKMAEADKAKIAVIGACLMGHGIAQVFALAGHPVKVTDTVVKNLDTVASRIAANLRDLGEDEHAVERVEACVDLTDAVHDADYVV